MNIKYKPQLFIISIAIVMIILSCNKTDDNKCADPQIPGEYFPAFPKSWWEYRKSNGDLIK